MFPDPAFVGAATVRKLVEFGVSPVITKTLAKYGLHAEWINAGELGVYEN